ncbi:cytochrome b [Rhodoblastus sp. 17X3]|uniref:cytochrome b n=1 Tax=Rhodoblastus sp. 17X3 TaxID=3047026 RepID=UPI0024B71EC1|nr:cytochrome b [Rhodoblastus sp. 17X3]MDI9849380.1 cytochrome b [Rhodoblastus sp. 17X3]
MSKPPIQRYDVVAVVLHWTMALGIIVLIGVGLAMKHADLPKMRVFQLFQLHKSIGVVILLLAVVRLAWRLTHRAPPLPETMPALERTAAHAGHVLLYLFMFALPLSGWAFVSASPLNIPTVLFGLLSWPHIPFLAELTDKAPVAAAFKLAHDYGAFALIAVLAIHIGAALRHAFKGDAPLSRMSLSGGRKENAK